jgi:hyperosmotically inducible periplasmic protein
MFKTSIKGATTLKLAALIVSVATLPVLCGVTGCSTGSQYKQSTGEYIDDHGTSSRVKKALGADPKYKYDAVKVETFKGTVQLSGFVPSAEQKSRAGELARNAEGVREVENNITVRE